MLTHSKPIEERVRGLICRQLMLRVYDDDRIFINKADYVEFLCSDIVALARAGGDIDAALAIAVEM